MKFEEWWVTLTPVDRRVIGAATGKFVWDSAYKYVKETLEKEKQEKPDANS